MMTQTPGRSHAPPGNQTAAVRPRFVPTALSLPLPRGPGVREPIRKRENAPGALARRLSALAWLCLSAVAAAELGVTGPVLAPIRHRPGWRFEEALFGYRPLFTPGIACFDADNRPYLRWEDSIQTLDAAGQWVRLPFTQAPAALFPSWDGTFMQGYFAEEHVVFDDSGDAYTTVNASRSSIGRIFLLHSRDRCRTWTAYAVGMGYPRLERRDGHTCLSGPPALLLHDAGLRGVLQLVVPEKRPDGTLDVSISKVISEDSLLVPNHSGGGNSVITLGDRLIVAYPGRAALPGRETAGTPQYVIAYDRKERRLAPPVLLGLGGAGRPDAHNLPAIAADSQGIIHAVLGSHHEPFLYTHSLKPGAIDGGWTEPVPIGTPKRRAGEGSYTYVGLVCDARDTLHVVGRWAGDGYTFKLAYLRKRHDQPWEANRDLVIPAKGNYHVWYHKLTLDRRDRLFVNYVCRASIQRQDEIASFERKWPALSPEGGFLTQSHCLLMSDDGGDSWRLATSADLGASVTATPAPAPPVAPLLAAVTPHSRSSLGGTFGASAAWDHFLAVAVDRRVQVLDVATPAQPRLLSQTAPFGDTIMALNVCDGALLISAWRDGLHRCAVSADGRLGEPARLLDGEARAFVLDGRHLLLCQGAAGLWLGDLGQDGGASRRGAFTGRHAYAVARSGDTAYLACGHQGLALLDLSDPAQPRELRLLCEPASSTDRTNATWNVAVSGNRLYACPGPAPVSLRVFDITEPRNPREVGSLENDWGWGSPLAFHAGNVWFSGLRGLRVLSDADTPTEVGHWTETAVGPLSSAGSVGFLARGVLGLTLLDLSDPTALRELGRYEETRTPFCVAAAGADRVLVADWDYGLRLMTVSPAGLLAERASCRELPRVLGLDVRGDLAIAALGTDGIALLRLDGLNPPALIGRLATEKPVRDAALGDGVAFLAEAGRQLRVLSLATPATPVTLAVAKTVNEVLSLAAQGTTVYAGEAQCVAGGLQCYRWQDSQLTALGRLELAADLWGMGLAGHTLTTASGVDGCWQIDVADPAALRAVGRLQVDSAAWDVAYLGERLCVARGADGIAVLEPP